MKSWKLGKMEVWIKLVSVETELVVVEKGFRIITNRN